MKNLNYRNLYKEITEKEKPTPISTERKVKCLCKCWSKEPTLTLQTKEVFSDGWTRWICSNCGKVKFTRGTTFKEEK